MAAVHLDPAQLATTIQCNQQRRPRATLYKSYGRSKTVDQFDLE
jgi:hypothetical protein